MGQPSHLHHCDFIDPYGEKCKFSSDDYWKAVDHRQGHEIKKSENQNEKKGQDLYRKGK